MKLTRHNGHSGKHGTYNPKHNDRRFDVTISDHIDETRVAKNIYWDCVHGFRTATDQNEPDKIAEIFSEVERLFYKRQYDDFVDNQNERNAKTRHIERIRYIAINDNVDTLNGESELAPFLNILNEMHARQTSKKVKAAMKTRFANGAHYGAYAPHGYIKDQDKKGHLLIDHETI